MSHHNFSSRRPNAKEVRLAIGMPVFQRREEEEDTISKLIQLMWILPGFWVIMRSLHGNISKLIHRVQYAVINWGLIHGASPARYARSDFHIGLVFELHSQSLLLKGGLISSN